MLNAQDNISKHYYYQLFVHARTRKCHTRPHTLTMTSQATSKVLTTELQDTVVDGVILNIE